MKHATTEVTVGRGLAKFYEQVNPQAELEMPRVRPLGNMNYLIANAVPIALCSLANCVLSDQYVFEKKA
jgi:hypothetical protein